MTPLVLLLALLAWQAGPAVDAPDADGLTALMRASARGDGEAVTALVSRQADVNLQAEGTGISALMCAAYFGRTEVIQLLLARGAKPDLKDATGASAADWAGAGSRAAAGDVLAKAGSQLNPFLNVGVLPFALMDKAGAAKRE